MEIKTKLNNDILNIIFIGNIDSNNAHYLSDTFKKILQFDKINGFYLNFTSVSSITSSGIGKLLTFHKTINKLCKTMEIKGISDSLYSQFIDLHLDRIFTIKK